VRVQNVFIVLRDQLGERGLVWSTVSDCQNGFHFKGLVSQDRERVWRVYRQCGSKSCTRLSFTQTRVPTILTVDSMTRNPTKTSLMIMVPQGSGLFGISWPEGAQRVSQMLLDCFKCCFPSFFNTRCNANCVQDSRVVCNKSFGWRTRQSKASLVTGNSVLLSVKIPNFCS
jgi:hypothetical protein